MDLPPGNGRGIHLFEVNRETGAWAAAGVHEMGTSPSCLAINSSGTRLYSANETDRVGKGKEGTVSAFSIDGGKLKLLNSVRSGGAGPTYVSIHPSGKFLLVANYFGGSVSVLPVTEKGLGGPTDVKNDAGKVGPTRAKNAPPGSFAFSGHDRTHAHMIQSDPSGEFVLHVDLGLDKIFVWKFDEKKGSLAAKGGVSLPPGDGPRHFHFHPNGKWLYSIQEEGSTVVLFDYDAGKLAARQTTSTLPKGFAGSNFCSGVLVSADGKFVYAGNRLHDSIAIFSVGEKGTLTTSGRNGRGATTRAASASTRPAGSSTAATSGPTTSPPSRWTRRRAASRSLAGTCPSGTLRTSSSSTRLKGSEACFPARRHSWRAWAGAPPNPRRRHVRLSLDALSRR